MSIYQLVGHTWNWPGSQEFLYSGTFSEYDQTTYSGH